RYFVYAGGNVGGMLGLLGYPTLVEPNLRLATQAVLWVAGYVLLLGLCGWCAFLVWRSGEGGRAGEGESGRVRADSEKEEGAAMRSRSPALPLAHAPTVWRRLRWIALACVPSSLMLGVTAHITTDVAPIPLLWVIPLALYLLSFILVFSRLPTGVHAVMMLLLPLLILLVVFPPGKEGIRIAGFSFLYRVWHLIEVHLLTLFVAAMVCHGELARTRPAPSHLTEFYLWISVGGVLGGLFNALVAPLVFDAVLEYPLVVALACLLLPRVGWQTERPGLRRLDIGLSATVGLFGAVVGGFLVARAYLAPQRARNLNDPWRRPAEQFATTYNADQNTLLHRERSFFGVLSIDDDGPGRHHLLTHGTTAHGVQQ